MTKPPPPPRSVSELQEIAHRVTSPDARMLAVTYLERESRMGWYDSRIVLAEAGGRIVEAFDDRHSETTRPPSWSPDSAWLVFPTRAGSEFIFLAWHVATSRFGLIRVANPYPLELAFEDSRAIRLSVQREQVEAANSDVVFGGGRSEAPVRRYSPTPPATIELASLPLHSRDSLSRLTDLAREAPLVELGLVRDGYHPYDGPGLVSTLQEINGRALEGHHLEAFAEHGDPVARAWLDELKQRMGKKYDAWAPVAKVLGTRCR